MDPYEWMKKTRHMKSMERRKSYHFDSTDGFEGIMLSEIHLRKRKTNTVQSYLYVES